jgi:hypothetical protein
MYSMYLHIAPWHSPNHHGVENVNVPTIHLQSSSFIRDMIILYNAMTIAIPILTDRAMMTRQLT